MRAASRGPYQLGLTGWPLGHSLSPVMHAAALKAAGLEGGYSLFPVQPLPEGESALRELIARLKNGDLSGLNVTIPHKQSVLPLLDSLSPACRMIGAVNTIHFKDGQLLGENTDCAGFLADMVDSLPDVRDGLGRTALVLGAGGSARAVVYALRECGWKVVISARRPEQSRQLAEKFFTPDGRITSHTLDGFPGLSSIRLIVNTTPAGMSPNVDACAWPDDLPFPPDALLYDLIYNPAETLLMRRARLAGLTVVNGLGMLAGQAALAFEIWTGCSIPAEVFRKAAFERNPS